MEKTINPYDIKIGDKLYSVKEDDSEFGYSLTSKTITEIKISDKSVIIHTDHVPDCYFKTSDDYTYFEQYTQNYCKTSWYVSGRWSTHKDFVKSELKRIMQNTVDKLDTDIVKMVFESNKLKQRIEIIDELLENDNNN